MPEGHRGCLTSYVAPSLIVAAASVGRSRPLTIDDVLELARRGDPLALKVVQEAAYAIGHAAAEIASTTFVDAVILSGEGIHLCDLAEEALIRGFQQYASAGTAQQRPLVRPMDFFEWARGAAVTAIHAEFPGDRRRSDDASRQR
ncbi:ROK family protein [Microbacterium sp. KUDC0406]|uniref:ROK family protein n=1 Tax=Microbacterium sp. KUDC0406 TaxID=2909588 RepID=UPI001F476AFE|nr:ROK family protein [Microbacterium sp. KUDC0406]UJP09588.1 ROK family protein [Microbacterium sp. KUDC0406]